MKQLKWAYFQLMLRAVEIKLWMDGMPWEDVRFIVAERLRDLARATHEGREPRRID
jgi:hypothetical protein